MSCTGKSTFSFSHVASPDPFQPWDVVFFQIPPKQCCQALALTGTHGASGGSVPLPGLGFSFLIPWVTHGFGAPGQRDTYPSTSACTSCHPNIPNQPPLLVWERWFKLFSKVGGHSASSVPHQQPQQGKVFSSLSSSRAPSLTSSRLLSPRIISS